MKQQELTESLLNVLDVYKSGAVSQEFPPDSIDLQDPTVIQRLVTRVKELSTQKAKDAAADQNLPPSPPLLTVKPEVIDLTSSQEWIQEQISTKVISTSLLF